MPRGKRRGDSYQGDSRLTVIQAVPARLLGVPFTDLEAWYWFRGERRPRRSRIRQMKAQAVTVNQCTVSTTVTAGGSNTGNATVVASTTGPNGLLLEYCLTENILLTCTEDQNHGATAGQEQVTITSPAAASSALAYQWPAGSGISATTTVIDPTQSNGAGGNLLNNSAFKSFSGNTPTSWTVDVGSAQIRIEGGAAGAGIRGAGEARRHAAAIPGGLG